MQQDVIVVGAGLGGMVAALYAAEEGATVLLVDRGAIGLGTNSAISNAAFTSPTEVFGRDEYIAEVFAVGKGLNNSAVVEMVARDAVEAIESLENYGVQFNANNSGYDVKAHHRNTIRGVAMVEPLAAAVKSNGRIRTRTGFYVTEFIVRDDRICGVRGFDNSGTEDSLFASTVVIAAGGAGGLYLRNDNQKSTMGQGYALCACAGIDLLDMEFVQFYPLVIADSRLPGVMLYPPYPKEARLVDADGADVARKHGLDNLSQAIRKKRDAFSEIVYREGQERPVFMDYRDVPDDAWDKYPVSLLKRIHFDFKKKPIQVAPGAHYCMGGIRIDDSCQTSLKGLFACGEIVWGLHGANRRGGNALTECAVFGRIAGRAAAGFAKENAPLEAGAGETAQPAWVPTATSPALKTLQGLRKRIREIAWNQAGVLRHQDRIQDGARLLSELESELQEADPFTIAELKLKQDLKSAVLVLTAILTASLERKESRGSFVREEYPEMDDVDWKKNSCLSYEAGSGDFTVRHYPTG